MKWYEKEGSCGDIVVSSRIRLARNLKEYPFPSRLTEAAEKELLGKLSAFLLQNPGFRYLTLDGGDDNAIGALVEQHLISPELAGKRSGCGVVFSEDEHISVMLNEEDHIRLQVLGSGFCLKECLEEADRLDDALERQFAYAWNERLGYLTCCPTNLGTGLRASVMLHLPALTETGEIRSVVSTLGKLGFAVRGLYGEGSSAVGCLYQVSNQLTLGPTEAETLERLESAVHSAIDRERSLRTELQKRDPDWLADRCWRAYGLLKNARRLSTAEAMKLLSDLRMGIGAEQTPQVETAVLNNLLRLIQPHMLAANAGKALNEQERDRARAELLRSAI